LGVIIIKIQGPHHHHHHHDSDLGVIIIMIQTWESSSLRSKHKKKISQTSFTTKIFRNEPLGDRHHHHTSSISRSRSCPTSKIHLETKIEKKKSISAPRNKKKAEPSLADPLDCKKDSSLADPLDPKKKKSKPSKKNPNKKIQLLD
jgi:hypothetical protein